MHSKTRIVFRWIGLSLCLASIGLNVLLAKALIGAFAEVQFARIFPLGYVEPSVPADVPVGSERTSIAIYGDSRAALWDTKAFAPHYGVFNFAHGGQTSSQTLLQIRNTPIVHTRWALVQVGINDVHPLGALSQHASQAVENVQENIPLIVASLRERADTVIVSTIIPPGAVPLQRRIFWDAEALRYVAQINEVIRQQAEENRVMVLDADRLLRVESGFIASEYEDGDFFLHINASAYALLNEELQRLLSSG